MVVWLRAFKKAFPQSVGEKNAVDMPFQGRLLKIVSRKAGGSAPTEAYVLVDRKETRD